MDTNIPKMQVYIPGYPDDMGHFRSITKFDNPCGNLYVFMFHESVNEPCIHLIDFINNINYKLYLNKPFSDHKFSKEEKEYINQWMHDVTGNDHHGKNTTNWDVLRLNWMIINSKFEEDYYDQTGGKEYDWSKIFPDTIPDYNLLP